MKRSGKKTRDGEEGRVKEAAEQKKRDGGVKGGGGEEARQGEKGWRSDIV